MGRRILVDRGGCNCQHLWHDLAGIGDNLSDVEGLSYEEVAKVLDVPVGTVKSRLYRGRRLLQAKLYDYAVSMGYIKGQSRK